MTGALLVTSLSQVGPPPDPVIAWLSVVVLAIGLVLVGRKLWDYWDARRGRGK